MKDEDNQKLRLMIDFRISFYIFITRKNFDQLQTIRDKCTSEKKRTRGMGMSNSAVINTWFDI